MVGFHFPFVVVNTQARTYTHTDARTQANALSLPPFIRVLWVRWQWPTLPWRLVPHPPCRKSKTISHLSPSQSCRRKPLSVASCATGHLPVWFVAVQYCMAFYFILYVRRAKTQKSLSHSGWILCVVLQTAFVLLAWPGKILTFSVTKSVMPDIVFTEAFSEYSWQFSGCDLHHCKSFVCLFIPKPGLWSAGKCQSIIRNYWVPNGMNYGLMLEKILRFNLPPLHLSFVVIQLHHSFLGVYENCCV